MKIKNNQKLAHNNQYLFILLALFSFLSFGRRIFIFYVSDVSKERMLNKVEIVVGRMFTFLVAWPHTLLLLLSAVVFYSWFYRTYFNLHQLQGNQLKNKVWMSVVGFIIPWLNLFKPFQVMEELYEKLQQYIKIENAGFTINRSKVLVHLWWAFYLTAFFIVISIVSVELNTDKVPFRISNTLAAIFDLVCIPLALLTWALIRKIATFEKHALKLL